MNKIKNKEICHSCDLVKLPLVSISETGKYTNNNVNKNEIGVINKAINCKILGDMGEESDIEKEWRIIYGIQLCVNIVVDKNDTDHIYKMCWCGSQGIEKFNSGIKKARAQVYTAVNL